jgi:hypothetical protein
MNDGIVCEIREAELRVLLREETTNIDNAKCAAFEALDAVKYYRTELKALSDRVVACRRWPGCGCSCHP